MTPNELPHVVAEIGERIRTQDNRITSHPVFVVEQKRKICGLDDGYADGWEWYDPDACEVYDDAEKAARDAEREADGSRPVQWRHVGYVEIWEFVTACFTEQGCKDYIAANGHNLREPRIYAHSGYRNAEWQAMREYLSTLTAQGGDAVAEVVSVPRGWLRDVVIGALCISDADAFIASITTPDELEKALASTAASGGDDEADTPTALQIEYARGYGDGVKHGESLTAAPAMPDGLLPLPPTGWVRNTDGRWEIRIGGPCPPDRSGGFSTPWSAIYDTPTLREMLSMLAASAQGDGDGK